jgi:hypothetical protein
VLPQIRAGFANARGILAETPRLCAFVHISVFPRFFSTKKSQLAGLLVVSSHQASI